MPAPASYPRAPGVLAPSCLVRAGLAVTAPADDAAGRSGAAAQVVAWMRRSRRRLPPELLALELGAPRAVLDGWVIGRRTRGSLERLLSTPGGAAARTVRDYLGAPWVGVHGLVDLLAAHQENQERARAAAGEAGCEAACAAPREQRSPAATGAARADRLSAVIRGLLPAPPAGVVGAVVAAGLASEPVTLDELARLHREHDAPAPFRVVRRGGGAVLVAPQHLAAAEALVTGAARLVFTWGLCTLDAAMARLRALSPRPLDEAAAARVLTALPRFRWLDRRSGWFSFAGSNSRLREVLRKVFAAADRVPLGDLRAALSKQIPLLATVPEAALETYLTEVAGCRLAGGWVGARAPDAGDDVPLGRAEETIVALVRGRGGEVALRSLGEHARREGLSARALLRAARTSPLVLKRGGRLRLVGTARAVSAARAA